MYTTNVEITLYIPAKLEEIRRKMTEKLEDVGGGKEEK